MRVFLPLALLLSLACAMGPKEPAAPAASSDDIVQAPNSRAHRARRAPPAATDDAVRGRYVVKFRDDAGAQLGSDGRVATGRRGLDDAMGRAGIRKARAVHRRGSRGTNGLFAVDADVDEATFQSLMAQDGVEWVEPVRRYDLTGYDDPYYKYQWDMAELQLETVHGRAQGQGVIVAVVDSGVTPGTDGPANVLSGWDFQDDDADAQDSAAATQSSVGSHGTHVAGTIAQITNNGKGVVGIAPKASILPVRVGDYNGVTSENIAEGIEWAVDHGAQVINISIGGSSPSRVIEEACRYAYEKGVVVVAATGNEGYDGKISYPAAYSTVIAVGAHDAALTETSYSNSGSQLALLAPGGDSTQDRNGDGQPDGILQGTITSKGWGYAMMEGTSMASPHVAGAAAILISAGITGPDAVRSALVGGAKNVNGKRVLSILGALEYKGPVTTVDPGGRAGAGAREGKGAAGPGARGGRGEAVRGEGSRGEAPRGGEARGERPRGGAGARGGGREQGERRNRP